MAVPGKRAEKKLPLSTTSIRSDEDLNVYCQPCDQEGPRLPAYGFCRDCSEHLCETCFKVHKRHKLSRHHVLLDKESMPKTIQLSSISDHASKPGDFTIPCSKHKKELIKFYCHDHKALLCSVCVTLEHTVTSCHVDYIPDISGQIIDSKEYKDRLKNMNIISDQCQKMLAGVKDSTAKSNRSLTGVLADINKFRKEINQRLDELERQAEDAAKAIQQENDKNQKSVETICGDITKSLMTSSDAIKHLNTSKQTEQLFMEMKFAEQVIQDYEKSIQQLSAYDVKEYNFKPNEVLSNILETEKSLGALSQKTLMQKSTPPSVDVTSRQTISQGECYVKTSKDIHECCITGMTLLTPDLLIITDWNNFAVKMVDTNSQSVTDQLQLDTAPHDVTSDTSTDIAVTQPYNETVQFLAFTSNKLSKKHIMKVDGRCCGISRCQGKFVVSFYDPAKLQILDSRGRVLTTVKGENIFIRPLYVTTNSTSIYVSDRKMKTVTRLNWQGEMIGSYGDASEPQGIALSDDGTVFMCDREKHVIEEMSEDCSTRRVVLKELKYPKVICWCDQRSTLYISSFNVNDKYNNILHFYKLS